jgi:hypothetical protein
MAATLAAKNVIAPHARRACWKRLASWVVVPAAVAFAASSAGAQTPRAPLYSQPLNAPPPAAPPAQTPSSAGAALQGEATLDQIAAYQQYLLYLSTVSSQPAASSSQDVGAYFRNGAAVTSVPSPGQPGSAYFSNGASVTSVPAAGQPGSAYFSNGAEVTRLPLAAPTAPTAPPQLAGPPRSSVPATPPPTSSSPVLAASPLSSTAPTETLIDGPVMSFEAWLQSMGAPVESERETTPGPPYGVAYADRSLAEPTADADEARTRATYELPEQTPERGVIARKTWRGGLVAILGGTFAIGLLLGALAMRRTRAETPLRAPARRRSTSAR